MHLFYISDLENVKMEKEKELTTEYTEKTEGREDRITADERG